MFTLLENPVQIPLDDFNIVYSSVDVGTSNTPTNSSNGGKCGQFSYVLLRYDQPTYIPLI